MATGLIPDSIIAIEFDADMNPFSIWTRDHWNDRAEDDRAEQWDVEFSKANEQFYYHNSGSGPIYSDRYNPPRVAISPAFDFWVADDVPFEVQGGFFYYVRWSGSFAAMHRASRNPPPQRLPSLPDGLDLGQFIDDAHESEVTYCSECNDWFPSETDCLCEHMAWCDRCGDHTTNKKTWRFAPGKWGDFRYISRCADCDTARDDDDE